MNKEPIVIDLTNNQVVPFALLEPDTLYRLINAPEGDDFGVFCFSGKSVRIVTRKDYALVFLAGVERTEHRFTVDVASANTETTKIYMYGEDGTQIVVNHPFCKGKELVLKDMNSVKLPADTFTVSWVYFDAKLQGWRKVLLTVTSEPSTMSCMVSFTAVDTDAPAAPIEA